MRGLFRILQAPLTLILTLPFTSALTLTLTLTQVQAPDEIETNVLLELENGEQK